MGAYSKIVLPKLGLSARLIEEYNSDTIIDINYYIKMLCNSIDQIYSTVYGSELKDIYPYEMYEGRRRKNIPFSKPTTLLCLVTRDSQSYTEDLKKYKSEDVDWKLIAIEWISDITFV